MLQIDMEYDNFIISFQKVMKGFYQEKDDPTIQIPFL